VTSIVTRAPEPSPKDQSS